MTSATGRRSREGPSGRRVLGASANGVSRGEGFTLVEILVVLAIIVLLFSLVTVNAASIFGKANLGATKAMVLRLETYLDSYRRTTGSYPPDGVDSPVRNEDGTSLYATSSVQYHLTRPIVVEEITGSVKRLREYEAVVETAFKSSELSRPDPDFENAFEIVDGWGIGFHYDNTSDGRFRAQRGDVHIPPLDDDEHPPDPRSSEFLIEEKPAVPHPDDVQSTGFDLWSHGEMGHEIDEKPNEPIASWNMEE